MSDKFRVTLTKGRWQDPWPEYFDNFYRHCQAVREANHWHIDTVINHELKPLGGRLIITKTQGWYLRWNREESHTVFVLKWS